MRTLIVIPARMAASRLPGKPLADIHGRPMIAWVAEAALRAANAKFTRRFKFIEDELEAGGRSPAAASLDEMEALWIKAKKSGM